MGRAPFAAPPRARRRRPSRARPPPRYSSPRTMPRMPPSSLRCRCPTRWAACASTSRSWAACTTKTSRSASGAPPAFSVFPSLSFFLSFSPSLFLPSPPLRGRRKLHALRVGRPLSTSFYYFILFSFLLSRFLSFSLFLEITAPHSRGHLRPCLTSRHMWMLIFPPALF